MKNSAIIITALCVSALSGCASTPSVSEQAEDRLRDNITLAKDIEATKQGQQELDSVRYMGRMLMPSDVREEFVLELQDKIPQWDPTNVTFGFLGAALTTDSPFSVAGSVRAGEITLALDAINFIFDGSEDTVGQMYLPDTVNGESITSAEQASETALTMTENAMNETLAEMGYSNAEYQGNFQHDYLRLYTATLEERITDKEMPTYPDHVTMLVAVGDYVEVEAANPLDQMVLGFQPAYQSNPNGHIISFLGGKTFDADGNVVTEKLLNGKETVSAAKDLLMTAIGRSFYRGMTSKIPWVYGKDVINNRTVIFNGEAYKFNSPRFNFVNARFDS